MKRKVIVATSGGVDSSVAAALLTNDWEVIGLHITKNDLPGYTDQERLRDKDSAESAASVAGKLDVPLRFVEAGGEFHRLIDFFCREYNEGRTPNPCVVCNVNIKWRIMLETADREGAEFVATGHYAKVLSEGGAAHLVRGAGGAKDQTYFLHRLTQKELARTIFPLSELTKAETRRLAKELRLPTMERAESQEICFVGQGGYAELLRERTPEKIRGGEVIDATGKVIGRHEGYQFYTLGQRKGLKIALGTPAYVTAIDATDARVRLGGAEELLSRAFAVTGVNWLVPPAPEAPFRALVRIRYNHDGAPALVTPRGTDAEVKLDRPVRAVTPGQAAVFYIRDEVVGGGWIAPRPAADVS